jgi:hypothetical protein
MEVSCEHDCKHSYSESVGEFLSSWATGGFERRSVELAENERCSVFMDLMKKIMD